MQNNSLKQNDEIGCLTGQDCSVSSQESCAAVKPFRIVYIILGAFFVILGAIGTVLPLIPTTPLILLAAVCFGKSSQKLHEWFLSTSLYRKTIHGFVKNHETTIKTKITLLTSVTIIMGLSYITMVIFQAPAYLRIILAVIWLSHIIYFGFLVKTTRK